MLFLSFCAFAQFPQGFEGTWPPAGWGIYQNDVGTAVTWQQSVLGNDSQPPHTGSHAAFLNLQNVTTGIPADWLVTPQFERPANAQLRFWSRLTLNGNQGSIYKIYVSTAANQGDLSQYTLVQQWTENEINPSQQEYIEKVVPLPGPAGEQIYVAFVMEADNGDRWLIDDVNVVEQCLDPTDLMASEFGLDTATLDWENTSGATSWEIEIITADLPPTGNGFIYNGQPPYMASGLDDDTDYKFYVKAICGPDSESNWVGAFNFSTVALGATCNAPITITALPYSTTDNTINYDDDYSGIPGTNCGTEEWEEYLNGDDVVYAYTAPADGVISIDMDGTDFSAGLFVYTDCDDIGVNCVEGGIFDWEEIPVSIPNLAVAAGTTYYIVISTWGEWPQTTPYNLVIQQVNCAPPTGFSASNIGQTSAELSWQNPSNASSWEIVIQAPGTGIPAGAGTTVNTNTNYLADGLTVATPYEVYIRADCGDGTFSAWAGPYLFNTTICEPIDQCTYTFIMTDSWGDGWNGGMMAVTQNGITLATIGQNFTAGPGPVSVSVEMCNSLPFELFWTSGGSFPEEMGVSIQNSFGQIFFTKAPGTGLPGTAVYSGTIDCDNPMCLPPNDLTATNITMTTADLGWAGPDTGNWDYYIVEAGEPAPTDGTPGTNTTTNPVNVTGLTAATNYEYYVRYICSDTESSVWGGPYAFHTAVCEPDAQCIFTFEMTSQNGWNWGGNTMTIYQGGVAIATIGEDFDWNSPDMYSQSVDIPLCPDVEIEIFWNFGGWDDYDKGLIVYTPFMEDLFTMAPGSATQGTTVFTGIPSCEPPACPKPQMLTATDITLTTAQLGWNEMGSADTWEVVILPLGSPAPTEPGTVVNGTASYFAENLDSGTVYVYYVRANCGDEDGYSTWSGPFTFITLIANDDCDNATPVPVNPSTDCIEYAMGTITGATASGAFPSCAWSEPENDVWYEFVATSATHGVSINNQEGATFAHVIYEGDNCGNLTELSCSLWNSTSTVSELTIGNTYFVQVFTDWLPNPSAITSFEVCVLSPPPPIRVSTDEYTVEELISDVLIGTDCAQITNVNWSTGTDFGQTNGIAYFHKNNSSFSMDEGILLVCGDATVAPGPNYFPDGVANEWPGWDGDSDLEAAVGLPAGSTNDATYISFDFVTLIDELNFNFIFASEEYDKASFECNYSDSFAFILTDLDSGEQTNLAVLPGTDIPIQVTNIHPDNGFCGGINESYFGQYNDTGFDPINFNGQTVTLTASSPVLANHAYNIKMVIANEADNSHISAVFLQAGSFNIGQPNLGNDLLVSDGNAVCAGGSLTLQSGVNPQFFEFEWFHDGELMEGETGPNLVVTEPGEYTVVATYIGTDCESTATVTVEFYDPVEDTTGDPVDLTACDPSGFSMFDLSENTSLILEGLNEDDYIISYHLTEEDADSGEGDLELAYTNVTQFEQTIYVRIDEVETGCYGVKSFKIIVQDLTPEFEMGGHFSICDGTSGTIVIDAGNFDPADPEVSFTWTHDGNPFAGTGSSITVTEPGTYTVIIDNTGCSATGSVTVTVTPIPVADAPADVSVCDSYTLPSLSAGNNYYTGTNGTGVMLNAGDIITNTQTIYVLAATDTTPACTAENSFEIAITRSPMLASVGEFCEGNNYTLEAVFHLDEPFYNEDNVSFEWTDESGTVLGTGSTLVVANPGTYYVLVTPEGSDLGCSAIAEVEVTQTSCMIQKGISPNGDGLNDGFDLSALNVRKLSIFNRYGREVYSFNGAYTTQWRGQTDSGNDLPTGTYFYMIERDNGENKTGWVYINREEE